MSLRLRYHRYASAALRQSATLEVDILKWGVFFLYDSVSLVWYKLYGNISRTNTVEAYFYFLAEPGAREARVADEALECAPEVPRHEAVEQRVDGGVGVAQQQREREQLHQPIL